MDFFNFFENIKTEIKDTEWLDALGSLSESGDYVFIIHSSNGYFNINNDIRYTLLTINNFLKNRGYVYRYQYLSEARRVKFYITGERIRDENIYTMDENWPRVRAILIIVSNIDE